MFEGGTSAIDELLVGTRELEAFGLTLVGDLHGFLGLLLRLHGDFIFLVKLFLYQTLISAYEIN